ncbi:MAG: DUF4255 domain-containing protein [Myxococcales bacterium]|nr:DUF4255 domain-containing protein [Myxococcales bacterium]
MSESRERTLPPSFSSGPVQGQNIIGEITEAMHRFLLDGWTSDAQPPRIEEDLSFEPKDREEVIYVYMYRVAQNTALMNSKHWRPAKINLRLKGAGQRTSANDIYYERPPLYLNVFYLLAVHSKFRSDAERLMGWLLMRLYDATHLVYRPRKYYLPDGRVVDSTGAEWSMDADGDDVIMEKVGVSLVDDLTMGDAIHFCTIHEAPFRPFVTFRAQCAMEGPLLAGPPTIVRHQRAKLMPPEEAPEHPSGRMKSGRMDLPSRPKMHIGPPGYGYKPIPDEDETAPVDPNDPDNFASGEHPDSED